MDVDYVAYIRFVVRHIRDQVFANHADIREIVLAGRAYKDDGGLTEELETALELSRVKREVGSLLRWKVAMRSEYPESIEADKTIPYHSPTLTKHYTRVVDAAFDEIGYANVGDLAEMVHNGESDSVAYATARRQVSVRIRVRSMKRFYTALKAFREEQQ